LLVVGAVVAAVIVAFAIVAESWRVQRMRHHAKSSIVFGASY